MPESVEAVLGVLASLLETAPQCDTPAGIDATATAMEAEIGRLIRDVRGLKASGPR